VNTSAKPATVRFYFDADILGLAKVVAALRSDVTYPGDRGDVVHRRARPACPITSTDTDDTVWIPATARHGWLIITRDSDIQHHRAEIAAVRTSGARMIALAGEEARGTWNQLEVLMCQWRAIERRREESGPFIYSATRTRLRQVDLS
jgi:PIN like domain